MVESSCHIPVMVHEVVEYLKAASGGVFLDCTVGGGGHSQAILEANVENEVVAIDRDLRAVSRAKAALNQFGDRVNVMHGEFASVGKTLADQEFDGILVDLGLSSDQLAEQRGFSFHDETPLDMRMNEKQSFSAYDLVNSASEKELFVALKQGGVGKEARAVTRAIIAARPIENTAKLSQVVANAVYGKIKAKKTNPATLVFQAIRMAVNNELAEIEDFLEVAPRLRKSATRLAMITFHSLEDKTVTRQMRKWEGEKAPALWPQGMESSKDQEALGEMVSKKAIVPSKEEIERNARARSARLRVFEFY